MIRSYSLNCRQIIAQIPILECAHVTMWMMIACCSDGTRPVIFKIERLDYKVLYIEGTGREDSKNNIQQALEHIDGVTEVVFREGYVEVYLQNKVTDSILEETVKNAENAKLQRLIDKFTNDSCQTSVSSLSVMRLKPHEKDRPVLSNVSVEFEAGKMYAILGSSGSGAVILFNGKLSSCVN